MTLSQHKARLIIPSVFKLLKQKSILDSAQQRAANVPQSGQPQGGQAAAQATPGAGATAQPGQAAQPAAPADGQSRQQNANAGAPVAGGAQQPARAAAAAPGPGQRVLVNQVLHLIGRVTRDMPKWLWIFWLPQVLQFLSQTH